LRRNYGIFTELFKTNRPAAMFFGISPLTGARLHVTGRWAK
jgi:hypothetical protein